MVEKYNTKSEEKGLYLWRGGQKIELEKEELSGECIKALRLGA